LVKNINKIRTENPKKNFDKNTKKFGSYFIDFENELKSKIKTDVDVNKKALLNFQKYFKFWNDKTEKDINERNLIDFCNYVLKHQKATGSAIDRNKSGCYAIKMSITTLRKFLNFLFLEGIIKKETLQFVNNFVFTDYFTNCKKQLKKQTAFNHFNALEDVRNFYDLVLNIKETLEDFLEGNFEEKEYIAKELLKYKNSRLFNIQKAQSFLYKICVTEFLLLTGIRGVDFFKIETKNIKWQDKFIYFSITKSGEEYYLYLTDYLYDLTFNIYNLANQITEKNVFVATTHSNLRNFFNTFFKQQYQININIHGFRHTLKTLATKYLNYADLIVEEQLQHTINGIQKNYMKGDVKEKRLRLLEDYRLLITPLHRKYYYNIQNKERLEENVKNEIEHFFTKLTSKYNLKKGDLIKILLKTF